MLAGCQKPAETVSPAALRNQSAPVAAQVDATEARIAGDWRVVAGVGIPVGSKVSIGQGVMAVNGSALPLAQVGPGQFNAGIYITIIPFLQEFLDLGYIFFQFSFVHFISLSVQFWSFPNLLIIPQTKNPTTWQKANPTTVLL